MTYPELPDSLQALEEEILDRWRGEDLFRRTLDATADGEPFVFYEGPPTANGQPGLHHIISRTIKDLVCRHRTMLGRHVTRIAGWDTHGLPVEIEAEKKLGISGKPEIEEVGIARFNEVCRESVFTYKEEWEALSERIGYWLDYSRPYVTFHPEYVESVWWVLKELADRDLMYRGYKSVPYCPRCGTALSSHEVAQGYEEVEDPSLTFLCAWLAEDGSPDPEGREFVVWTTTPWTVPSNVGLAVHPDLTYVEVEDGEGRRLVLAEDRLEAVVGEDAEVLRRYAGEELVGTRYARPLEVVPEPDEVGNAWTVVAEDFVSAEDGTGIVHLAPAFGADDYAAGQRHDLPMLRPVDDGGAFEEGLPLVGGMDVKEADSVLVETLEGAGRLLEAGRVVHSYPHCWRCDSPLIYMARDSWFAATSTLKDELLANNDEVSWHPPETGEKRFGEWLRGNVDWALSRDRYWGTPLPVWVCDRDPDHVEWIGSFAELGDRVGGLPDDFDPHRPWIDEHAWPCTACGDGSGGPGADAGRGDASAEDPAGSTPESAGDGGQETPAGGTMRRTEAVVDVWFDSGAMPYAQWHYPFENEALFEAHFPADFICEAIDQTRGWFYSLLAIGTMLGRGTPFRSVVVNDMILDAEGRKMSKSRGNAVNPWDAVGDFGADAVRWYLVTVSNPWLPKRYDPEGVGEAARRFFDTLFNTYRFFALYARTESWEPSAEDPAPEERAVLDRWLLSRLTALVEEVSAELERYEITRAYRSVGDFLVEDLSNWYVRRSRARFWGNTDRVDQRAAFRTLHDALRTVALLVAPVAPFTADWLHRALTGRSAHLEPFPDATDATGSAGARDETLEEAMASARALVSLGRAAREEVQIRVRQPLRAVHAVLPGRRELPQEVLDVVRDELNVKEVRFLGSAEELVRFSGKPNFRSLGPRFQQRSEEAARAIRELSHAELAAFREGEELRIEVGGESHAVGDEDLEVVEEARGDLVVRSEGGHTAAIDPAIDEELEREGLARELVNRVQRLRRDAGLEITDRIRLGVYGPEEVRDAAEAWRDFIAGEVLAVEVDLGAAVDDGVEHQAKRDVDLDGRPAVIALTVPGAG